jgi:hypothetical protein
MRGKRGSNLKSQIQNPKSKIQNLKSKILAVALRMGMSRLGAPEALLEPSE